MKRLIAIILILLQIIFLSCCSNKNNIRQPVNFYYCTDPIIYDSSDGVISPEIREGDEYGEDLTALLDVYLRGPLTDGFVSPFPKGVYVENVSVTDGIISICLNKHFSQLTGYDLTLACACICMTVLDFTESQTIQISASEALLNGNAYIELSYNDLLFIDRFIVKDNTGR